MENITEKMRRFFIMVTMLATTINIVNNITANITFAVSANPVCHNPPATDACKIAEGYGGHPFEMG